MQVSAGGDHLNLSEKVYQDAHAHQLMMLTGE